MSEKQDREGARPEERGEDYNKNAEAKFASPDGSNEGIGYYFDGDPVSPEQFQALVARDADRLRGEDGEGE